MLPAKFTRRGAQLLHLQCWLWGQDVRRPEGNLLLQAGLERLRPPAGVSGCSQYTALLASGRCLKLWGFGIYCGMEQGCYLNRFEFVPRAADRKDCWTGSAFAKAPRTTELLGLPEALRWIAAYERWVGQEAGSNYRNTAALSGPDVSFLPCQLAHEWTTLAHDLESWLAQARYRPKAA